EAESPLLARHPVPRAELAVHRRAAEAIVCGLCAAVEAEPEEDVSLMLVDRQQPTAPGAN
ncbi:MAG: hypothetical protein ACRYFY_08775, partial [Janthinobacterium lividum]